MDLDVEMFPSLIDEDEEDWSSMPKLTEEELAAAAAADAAATSPPPVEEAVCTLSPDAINWMKKTHLVGADMTVDVDLLKLSYDLAHERTWQWTQSKHSDIIRKREQQRLLQRVNVGFLMVETCLIQMDKEGFRRILDAEKAK